MNVGASGESEASLVTKRKSLHGYGILLKITQLQK